MRNVKQNAGFTLVELAIVLVIIGLLVGGVLVGQDLIKAAEVSATTTQIQKYDSAANAFRTKYGGYPGDLRNAANFGLAATNAGGSKKGDGNAVMEPGACTDPFGYGGESAIFWTHLASVNLIPDGVNGITDYNAVAAVTIGDTYLPQARLGQGNRFHITSVTGRNYYVLSNMTATTITTCAITAVKTLTPQTAFNIDSKLDDGMASSGTIVSIASPATADTIGGGAAGGAVAAGDCYANTAAGSYATAGTYATATSATASALACQLRLKASF